MREKCFKTIYFSCFFNFSEIDFRQVVKIRQNKSSGPKSFLRDGLVLREFYLENREWTAPQLCSEYEMEESATEVKRCNARSTKKAISEILDLYSIPCRAHSMEAQRYLSFFSSYKTVCNIFQMNLSSHMLDLYTLHIVT
jgi:hypothetical protein